MANMNHTGQLLASVLDYAAHGMHVFPLHTTDDSGRCSCAKADCGSAGKHPRTRNGFHDATCDAATIRNWWTKYPDANIGLSTGASGRVVVDVDVKGGRPGLEKWMNLVAAYRAEFGIDLRDTTIVRTPSGGLHVHFRAGAHRIACSTSKLDEGIDVRGQGGYIVMPPSTICGVDYSYLEGHGLDRLSDLPETLAEDLVSISSSSAESTAPSAGQIKEGQRNEHLFRDAAAMRRRGCGEEAILAALRVTNQIRCCPPLSEDELASIALSAMRYQPADERVADGDDRHFHRSDAGNAELFTQLFGERLRFDHRRGLWYVKSEHHWHPDEDGAVYRLAIEAARERYRAAERIEDPKARENEAKFAIGSENRARIEGTLALAGCQLPITISGDEWNRDPELLGVANGVIDLRDGRLRPGRPEDLINYHTPVPYEPKVACPRWMAFLNEIFLGDEELVDWVWRVVGYLLTGLTAEQCFFVCYGTGANGKSVFLTILRALLGDYAYNAPFTTFEVAARTQIPNDVAALVGRRLVTASETSEGVLLNEARMKMLTGGDPVTARFLHREFFTYVPVAKFVLAVNHRPRIRDYSHGFWRRVRLIPFEARFEGRGDDRNLESKLRRELPGILAWAVNGCREWRARGLRPPAAVRAATAGYRTDSDPLAVFLVDCGTTDKAGSVKAREAYEVYTTWANKQGLNDVERLSRMRFYEVLESHFPKKHTSAGNVYLGLRLRDPDRPTLDEQ
jgi:putative DNA primase/helicase